MANWKVHGPVKTLETELAEWDSGQERWGPPRGHTICRFRPDGKIREHTFHNADGSIAHTAYLYDEAGRLVERQFRRNDDVLDRSLISYDGNGRYVQTVGVRHDGTRYEAEKCSYDNYGRMTKVQSLSPPDSNSPCFYGVEGSEIGYSAPGATNMTIIYDEHRVLPVDVRKPPGARVGGV